MAEYKRGRIWWVRFAGPDGETVYESTRQTDRRVAKAIYRQRKREVAEGTWTPRPDGPITVAEYAETWIAKRHERKLSTARDYEQRCRDHVLPRLGAEPLETLRPRHVLAFVEDLRGSDLSPRSVIHVYDCLRSLCKAAVIDEVIVASPCVLPPGALPKKRDKDPRWRATAVFTREEAEALISDERVPLDRRVLYALLLLTGMRFGEAAGRRWRDYDRQARPLGHLIVWSQYEDRPLKTEVPREVPVHPALAAILAEWRMDGFGQYMGRTPGPEDWIAPSRRGAVRSVRHTHRRLQEDLARLGYRGRRVHDTRRTFISLARASGARKDALRDVTHGPTGDIVDAYTTLPWATLCEAVSCLELQRRAGEVYKMVDSGTKRATITSGADGTRSPGGGRADG